MVVTVQFTDTDEWYGGVVDHDPDDGWLQEVGKNHGRPVRSVSFTDASDDPRTGTLVVDPAPVPSSEEPPLTDGELKRIRGDLTARNV